jgi:LysM repeat protein
MRLKREFFITGLIFSLLLTACRAEIVQPTQDLASEVTLVFYQSKTPTSSRTPSGLGTPTPLPSSTPTPRFHTIGRGDTFSGIAFKYGVSIQALQTANPLVDPYVLSVGTIVAIPPAEPQVYGTPVIPSPTPISLQLGQPRCYADASGGLWCFALVTNTQEIMVENITGFIRLADESGQVYDMQAYLPLDSLPAGASLPLAAFLPEPGIEPARVEAAINIALPVSQPENRFLAVIFDEQDIRISPDGNSAFISGEVRLNDPSLEAKQVKVVAVAYDSEGVLTGVRVWESKIPLIPGQRLPFSFRVYRSGGEISRVELVIEARP